MASKPKPPVAEKPKPDPKPKPEPKPEPVAKTFEELLAEGNLKAKMLENHGRWVQHSYHNRYNSWQQDEFQPCTCALCGEIRAELGLA